MFDTKGLLDQFLGTGGAGGVASKGKSYVQNNAGGLAGGAIAGGLAGLLLGTKSGRKLGKNALTYGGMALVGGLAYKAYRDYQAGGGGSNPESPSPHNPNAGGASDPLHIEPPAGSPFSVEQAPGGAESFALSLMQAMINAAKADGHIDADEQQRIFAKIDEADLDAQQKAFLMDELRAPLDIEKVVEGARTPEGAAEIYAASRLAIDPDHPAEQAYLQMLAARMGLEQGLVNEIEAAVREAEAA